MDIKSLVLRHSPRLARYFNVVMSKYLIKYNYAGFCPVCTDVVFWSGSVRLSIRSHVLLHNKSKVTAEEAAEKVKSLPVQLIFRGVIDFLSY